MLEVSEVWGGSKLTAAVLHDVMHDNVTSDEVFCMNTAYLDYAYYINILEDAYGC